MTSRETPVEPAQSFSPPVDIPWTLIAASQDMLDTTFCRDGFPEPWKSSIAVSAYEPPVEDLPDALCDQRVSYLKVSSSITGYVPTRDEIPSDYPRDQADALLGEYLGCYGVMLSVAIFPPVTFPDREVEDLDRIPRIVGFEPKTRDLYQVATEGGEILTGSVSKTSTTNSYVDTEKSETGFKLTAGVEVPLTKDPKGAKGKLGGEVSHTRTETDQDTYTVAAEASRERNEKLTNSTTLNQMYNLLSSYHLGTNRAVFMMLPRPHVLQPTDRRTFINGLRVIEGVQDFLIISVRPEDMSRMMIEVQLDTGHFPENVEVEFPDARYAESFEEFNVNVKASGSTTWRNECKNIHEDPTSTHVISEGWVIDRRADREDGQTADLGHPGMIEGADQSNSFANDSMSGYNYRAISDTTAQVFGRICGEKWGAPWDVDAAVFDRSYRILTRSVNPVGDPGEAVVTTPFLLRSRNLCTGVDFSGPCPVPSPPPPEIRPDFDEGVVDEARLSLRTGSTPEEGESFRTGAMKEMLRKIHHAMAVSPTGPTRTAVGERDLLDTDYAMARLGETMTEEEQGIRSGDTELLGRLDPAAKVSDIMKLPLSELMRRTGTTATEALELRRELLNLPPRRATRGRDESE